MLTITFLLSVVKLNVVMLSVVAPQPSQKIIILSQFRLKNYWSQPSSMKQTLMQVITKMINSSVGVSRKNANDSQVQCSQASLSQVKRSGDRVFPVLSKKNSCRNEVLAKVNGPKKNLDFTFVKFVLTTNGAATSHQMPFGRVTFGLK